MLRAGRRTHTRNIMSLAGCVLVMAGLSTACQRRAAPEAFAGEAVASHEPVPGLRVEIVRTGRSDGHRVMRGDWVRIHYATHIDSGSIRAFLVGSDRPIFANPKLIPFHSTT